MFREILSLKFELCPNARSTVDLVVTMSDSFHLIA